MILKDVFRNLFKRRVTKFLQREKRIISIEEEKTVEMLLFIKPWLYNFYFTFNDKKHPGARRDCYKTRTRKCLLDIGEEELDEIKKNIDVYNECQKLNKFLKKNEKRKLAINKIPYISTLLFEAFMLKLCHIRQLSLYIHLLIKNIIEKLERCKFRNFLKKKSIRII